MLPSRRWTDERFPGDSFVKGWRGFTIYSRDVLQTDALHGPSSLVMEIRMARGEG